MTDGTGSTAAPQDFADAPLTAQDRRKLERQLKRHVVYFRTLFDNLADGVVVLDLRGRIVNANRGFQTLFQYTPAELIGSLIDDRVVPEHLYAEAETLAQRVASNQSIDTETMRRRKDGRLVPVRVHAFPIAFGEVPAGIYVIYSDISQRRQSELALQHHQELAEVMLTAIGDGVIRIDADGAVRYLNPVAESLTGWLQADAVGQPVEAVFAAVDEETREPRPHPLTRAKEAAAPKASATLLNSRAGRETAIEDSVAPIRGADGRLTGALIVLRDITAARHAARQMAYQASHDALTGLANRPEFEHRLNEALSRARETGAEHSLLYLDLDQFKVVNDICGHQAGDELLRQLTTLLAADIRESDTLARLGGDEFGVLLLDCSAKHAERLAHKLVRVIEDFRFIWRQHTFAVGASIGVVVIDKDCKSLSELFAAADSACYSAKEKGRNRVRVYRRDALDLAQRHDEMGWVSRITQALEADRFLLYHQAISSLSGDDNYRRSEILLRLRDESGAIVAPDNFIPAAERYHLMPAVDRWVIRKVFAGLKRQLSHNAAGENEAVSINVSGMTIGEERFVQFLREQFHDFKVPPEAICFEITETAAIANLDEAAAFIDQIRALGCSISLDDFGSGLSSFAYLKTLNIDYLKIDGAFVRNMAEDPIDCAMVETINRVGKIMGVKTVAEYVEARSVLDKLRELDVDFAQGFDIHVPEPWVWGETAGTC